MFIKEFEASLAGQTPEEAFGKQGAVEEGYVLRAIPQPRHALWMMSRTTYRVPGRASGKVMEREDFARAVVAYGGGLRGAPGNHRICKFPGMETALFKTNLSLAFRDKDWYPVAYVLPKEKDELLAAMAAGGDKQKNLWIAKPKNNYAGAGIVVYPGNSDELQELVKDSENHPKSLVQRYLADPLLIGGYKFHMRIHLCITSLDPPEAYVQENGQCLFATEPYSLRCGTIGENFRPP